LKKLIILLYFWGLYGLLLHFKKLKGIFQFFNSFWWFHSNFWRFSFAYSILTDHPFLWWLVSHLCIILYNKFLAFYLVLENLLDCLFFINSIYLFLFKSFLFYIFTGDTFFFVLLSFYMVLKMCWGESFFQESLTFTGIYRHVL